MNEQHWHIQWAHNLTELHGLGTAWDAIFAADGRAHPFLSHDWCVKWWQQYAQNDWQLAIGLVTLRGTPVALMPWFLRPQKSMGITVNVLSTMGQGELCPPWLDVLGSNHDWATVPPRLLTQAIACLDWQLMDHAPMLPDSSFARFISPLFPANRVEIINCDVAPIIDVRQGFEQWLAELGSSTRKDIRRKRGRFAERSDFRILRHASPADVEKALPRLMQLNRTRLTSMQKHGGFHLPDFSAFHQQMIPHLAAQGECEIYELTLGSRSLAMQLYFGGGSTRYSYLSGMDPEAMDHGPGGMLDAEVFSALINVPSVHAIDLGVGDQDYKMRYGAVRRTVFRHTVFRSGWMRPLSSLRRALRRQIDGGRKSA
jgi:CelD/BcsL family acetyltransferase involved in cellulose biosynthesis